MLTEHNSLYKKNTENHTLLRAYFCAYLINTGEVEKLQ